MNPIERADAAVRRAAEPHADRAGAVSRVGLGAVILLAGAHKLVDPAVWSSYVAGPAAALWPLAMDPTMVANGAFEAAFGAALIADRYTALAAAVVAVSMVGVVANLAVVVALTGGAADILIRDLGLTALAFGVLAGSARRERR